ncbi:hypothetical protein K490DRAFT_68522 [Saccharata proteae CBS 121410]|uniref:Uncharacterized protein n=1 Tax=Saccharata proteae CBS 121410 TaxID=1314787 RepID=A0A9P4LSQ3_9PEZI|nr:hypothetical protein K490DRAFT_68522 [Saccharata proteae CBS 121410]
MAAPPPPPPPRVLVSVVVYVGDPVDFQNYRHTMVFFRAEDGGFMLTAHAMGGAGAFRHELRDSKDSRHTAMFAKEVPVRCLRGEVTKAQLSAMACEVPIDNGDPEFKCRAWVEAYLGKLYEAGYLLQGEYSQGVDGMMEAAMESDG